MENVDIVVTSELEDILDIASDGAVAAVEEFREKIYKKAEIEGNVDIMNDFGIGSSSYKAVLRYAERRAKALFD